MRNVISANLPALGNKYMLEGINQVDGGYADFEGFHEGGTSNLDTNALYELTYDHPIELSGLLTRNANHGQSPDVPPMCYFGCMPVQANPALAPTPVFANVVVQWVVETELICHFQHDFVLPHHIQLYKLQAWDPTIQGGIDPSHSSLWNTGYKAYLANRMLY